MKYKGCIDPSRAILKYLTGQIDPRRFQYCFPAKGQKEAKTKAFQCFQKLVKKGGKACKSKD